MTGCRYNAKNTLDKNYLHLAQQYDCQIIAEHEVTEVMPISENGSDLVSELFYTTAFNQKAVTFMVKSEARAGATFRKKPMEVVLFQIQ